MKPSDQNPEAASARFIATKAIGRVLGEGIQLEIALEQQTGYYDLSPRDRAFARLLISSVFRRLGQIDLVLSKFLDRDPPAFVKNVLRLGTAQILILKTPAHAAVGETVSLVKGHKKYRAFSGLVNAVLRKVDQKGKSVFAASSPQDNLPRWIARRWEKAYGKAAMRRMALQLTQIPPLDISVKKDASDWAQKLGGELLMDRSVRLSEIGSVSELQGYEDGAWWVQDLAASLPVASLGDISGLKVLDLCAAPGGKTLQLAAKGAELTALDRSGARLKRVHENLKRTGLKADIIEADVLEWDDPNRDYDIVLLDAPCSATGTYRRHPDVLQSKSPKLVSDLVKLQDKLLDRAQEWVKPGGLLVYCTCSLQPEEGVERAQKFLEKHDKFALNPITSDQFPDLPNEAFLDGMLQILPHFLSSNGGMDGFFTAKFVCNF